MKRQMPKYSLMAFLIQILELGISVKAVSSQVEEEIFTLESLFMAASSQV